MQGENPRLERIGNSASPLLSVDKLGPEPVELRRIAAALGPFPPARNLYPGVRRIIGEADGDAFAYVTSLLEAASPYLAGAFDLDGFDLVEASFSLVTTQPRSLSLPQSAPHFDDVDPHLYAVLHYAADCAGTAFYRHRASGIEVITPGNLDQFVAACRAVPASPGYITGTTAHWECIGSVAGQAGRLIAYPARLLHSGIITPDTLRSDDPMQGRLTTNLFIRARRSGATPR